MALDFTYRHTLKAKIRSFNCELLGFYLETILKSLISLKKIKSLLCLFKELNIKIKNLDTKEVELIAMAVDSSLHGKGVGSNLIYFASENLKKKGLISIFVRIFKNDLKIINFYSKNSFSLIQATNYFKVFRKKI